MITTFVPIENLFLKFDGLLCMYQIDLLMPPSQLHPLLTFYKSVMRLSAHFAASPV